jgi:hypothetical protein
MGPEFAETELYFVRGPADGGVGEEQMWNTSWVHANGGNTVRLICLIMYQQYDILCFWNVKNAELTYCRYEIIKLYHLHTAKYRIVSWPVVRRTCS